MSAHSNEEKLSFCVDGVGWNGKNYFLLSVQYLETFSHLCLRTLQCCRKAVCLLIYFVIELKKKLVLSNPGIESRGSLANSSVQSYLWTKICQCLEFIIFFLFNLMVKCLHSDVSVGDSPGRCDRSLVCLCGYISNC